MLSSSSRLLRLLSLLQSRRHWAGPELAERLEVHQRTLRRDIDKLRSLGYPVQASSGVAGGYAFRPGQALPPLMLEDDEALAVAIALRTAAAGTVAGVEEAALRTVVKLEQLMPARLRRRIDALRSAILPMEQLGPTVDAGMLATLAGACRDQLRLRFGYTDIRGAATQRAVEPQGVVYTGSRWYLVAWDPSREGWRTFRIDRISAPVEVASHFAPRPSPEGGDLRAFVSRSLSIEAYPERARVVLHAPLELLAQRISPAAGQLTALDAGRCVLECGIPSLNHMVHWLLAIDVGFEVLAPPALQQRLQAVAQRIQQALAIAASADPGDEAPGPKPEA